MNDRVAVALDRMLGAASNAIELTSGMTQAEFLADEKSKLAVMMCFVIIGEAAGTIGRKAPDFLSEHPNWPWNDMRAMRNVAAHAYFDLHFEEVWRTVRTSLPELVAQITALGPLDPRDQP